MIKRGLVDKEKLYFQEIEAFNYQFFSKAITIKSSKVVMVDKYLYIYRKNHNNYIQVFVYKSPNFISDAFLSIHKWLVDEKLYQELRLTFIKSFMKYVNDNASKCEKYENVYNDFLKAQRLRLKSVK